MEEKVQEKNGQEARDKDWVNGRKRKHGVEAKVRKARHIFSTSVFCNLVF
jgi:hypothetical protein